MSSMKKNKTVRKNKPNMAVEHRLTKLEEGLENVRTDISEVMLNVTNHIPTSIADVKNDLKTLLDRKQNQEAIKTFLTHLLKLAGSFAAFTWATVEIVSKFHEWGILK